MGKPRQSERNCRSIKMCLRYTLIISNALLALLGLLLLAGGVWLIVDEKSFEETAGNVLDDEIDSHEGLRDALEEVYGHNYFNYALLGMGGVTLLVALFGFCGAKKENQCLLSLYSICVFIIFLLQIAALVFINIEDENINIIRQSLDKELAKGDLDLSMFEAVGSKFTQNLFFGVSAGLSAFVFLLTVSLCCRTRREERVQAYIEAERA